MLHQEKNKSQQILEDRNYMKHFFHLYWYETKNQQQKEKWERNRSWRLNNVLLKIKWFYEDIKEKIRKYFKTNERQIQHSKICDMLQKRL